jgi:hypothetical protein
VRDDQASIKVFRDGGGEAERTARRVRKINGTKNRPTKHDASYPRPTHFACHNDTNILGVMRATSEASIANVHPGTRKISERV